MVQKLGNLCKSVSPILRGIYKLLIKKMKGCITADAYYYFTFLCYDVGCVLAGGCKGMVGISKSVNSHDAGLIRCVAVACSATWV